MAKSLHVGADARRSSTAINASSSAERRRLSSFSVGLDQLDAGRRLSAEAAAAREERRATGRMVAVIVALVMIFSGFYQAWIKRIPVLAGVMVPMLIMLLYAAWVLFLAKRDKQRRLNQVRTFEFKFKYVINNMPEIVFRSERHVIKCRKYVYRNH